MASPSVGTLLTAPLLLFSLLLTPALSYHITKSVSDTVGAGEVIHYTLSFSGPVVVVLLSDEGDVDIYASPTHLNSKPTSDDHELSSTSCGLDTLALIMSSALRQYTLGVYGHVRYQKSKFTMYVIEPSPEKIRNYQVWDWDPITKQDVLLIDADPMMVLNDLELTLLVERIQSSDYSATAGKTGSKLMDILHFMGVVLIKLLEILVEIIA